VKGEVRAGFGHRLDDLSAPSTSDSAQGHGLRALHAAGIEVILDMVYYHTAEAGPSGPTLCFRGAGPG